MDCARLGLQEVLIPTVEQNWIRQKDVLSTAALETGGFLRKDNFKNYDKSWSQSFNNASVMLCCMVRKANKDIIRGTEASYLMNKLDIYDTNKEKNQISNQNYQHLSSPRRKSALYFKGRWNMDLEGELSKYLLIFVFLDWNNQFVRIWHLKKITKKFFASNKDFDREQNRVKPWQFYNEQGQSR